MTEKSKVDETRKLRENLIKGIGTDCCFHVGLVENDRTEVHAHKSVMIEASPYFEKLMDTDLVSTSRPLKLPLIVIDWEAKIFEILVEYLHLKKFFVPMTSPLAAKLAIAAHHFGIESLLEVSTKFLRENSYSPIESIEIVDDLVNRNLTDIVKMAFPDLLFSDARPLMEIPEFTKVSLETLKFFLKEAKLTELTEQDLFLVCTGWANSQPDKKKSIRDLIPYLRLLPVADKHFSCLGTIECELTDSELALLARYHLNKVKPVLPASLEPVIVPVVGDLSPFKKK